MMTISRRTFLATSAPFLMVSGCSTLGESCVKARTLAPSEKVNLAVIGCGSMGWANVQAFLRDARVRITLACDVVAGRAEGVVEGNYLGYENFRACINKHYQNQDCRVTSDWREVVNDPTIDAVLIATSDHWHAKIAKEAMLKGKHIYCQKPVTLGIREGRELVRVANMTGVVFQVGNQGRSSSVKRLSAELVRNGYLGTCTRATVHIPGGPTVGYGLITDQKMFQRRKFPCSFTPEGWHMFLGPSQHWENDAYIPAIHNRAVWRNNLRTGNGIISDFSPHDVDTVQWAIGMDHSGPVAIENASFGDWVEPREILSWARSYSYDLVYANGFRCHVENTSAKPGHFRGVTYHGEKGDLVECIYGGQKSPLILPNHLKNWKESDLTEKDVHLHKPIDNHSHESDFIDGIYGHEIATSCEMGQRNTTVAILPNICQRLGVSRLTWDPAHEIFTGAHADEANKLLDVPYLNGWKL